MANMGNETQQSFSTQIAVDTQVTLNFDMSLKSNHLISETSIRENCANVNRLKSDKIFMTSSLLHQSKDFAESFLFHQS